jgi:hypothetical protein
MTLSRAQIAFAIAAFLFLLSLVLDLMSVATGRFRLNTLALFALAVGAMLTQ